MKKPLRVEDLLLTKPKVTTKRFKSKKVHIRHKVEDDGAELLCMSAGDCAFKQCYHARIHKRLSLCTHHFCYRQDGSTDRRQELCTSNAVALANKILTKE